MVHKQMAYCSSEQLLSKEEASLKKGHCIALKCSMAQKMVLTSLHDEILISLAHFLCAILNYTEDYKEHF